MTMVTTIIDSGGVTLTTAGYRRAGGRGSGAAHWWLRHGSGRFHSLRRLIRGDQPFRQTLTLPPGDYTLGTGRGLEEIRLKVLITEDGQARVRPASGGAPVRQNGHP